MSIPIGQEGTILNGDYKGWTIKVERQADGNLLVLIGRPASDEGFDDWVESETDLPDYFREAGWLVEWH